VTTHTVDGNPDPIHKHHATQQFASKKTHTWQNAP